LPAAVYLAAIFAHAGLARRAREGYSERMIAAFIALKVICGSWSFDRPGGDSRLKPYSKCGLGGTRVSARWPLVAEIERWGGKGPLRPRLVSGRRRIFMLDACRAAC